MDTNDFRHIINIAINELIYKMRGGGIKHLTKGMLDEYEFILPNIEEQSKIVLKLNTAQGLIGQRKKSIKLLDEYINSVFLEMFGDFYDGIFPLRRIQDIVKKDRNISYGIVQAGEHIEDGVPYIRSGDIKDSGIEKDKLLKTTLEIDERNKKTKCINGDIIFTIRATIGEVALINEELEGVNLSRGTALISPNELLVNRYYLLYLLKSKGFKFEINKYIKGATFKEINLDKLRDIEIPVPADLVKQNKFAAICLKIEKHKKEYINFLDLLNELLQSLQYNLFNKKEKQDEIDEFIDDEFKVDELLKSIISHIDKTEQQYNMEKDLLFKILERTEKNNKENKESLKGIVLKFEKGKIALKTNKEDKFNSNEIN